MAFKDEHLTKLTTTLASDIELYNDIIKHEQELSETVVKAQEEITSIADKLAETEKNNQLYVSQIANLLSRIPMGETQKSASFEQQIQNIKESKWTK